MLATDDVIMLRINALITLATIVLLAIIVTVVHQTRGRLETYRQAARQNEGRAMDFLGEIFSAVQTVKVGGAEEPALAHLGLLNETRRKSALKDTILGNILDSFSGNMTNRAGA